MALSAFASLAAAARGAVERVHGETATVRPMDRIAGPNGARGTSQTREPWQVMACLYRESDSVERDMRLNAGAVSINRAGRLIASVTGRTGPDGQALREGDILDVGGQRHEITAIDPDGLGHFTLTLSEAKS